VFFSKSTEHAHCTPAIFILLVVCCDDDGPGVESVFFQHLADLKVAMVGKEVQGDIRPPAPFLTQGGKDLFDF
jgi:hypothetical protein